MKAKKTNLNILGNDSAPEREILTTLLKQWRQRLGYCSIFAVIPAILASHGSEARSDEGKQSQAGVAGQSARLLQRLSLSCSTPALLKRQSNYLLPHQKGAFNLLATLAGNDDCPGRTIPGGNYTAASPYVDSGDTTGANNTVTRASWFYYCYYSYNVPGSDHVYSFTLTDRGANPQIQVSRTSGTYEPQVYILNSCPVNTGNQICSLMVRSGSSSGGTATISSGQMNTLPLSVPLYLFVDSSFSDTRGAGAYTIRIQDVTIAPAAAACPDPNPIDCPEFIVRQHYFDFLSREPDPEGMNFWTNEIRLCGSDAQCIELKRVYVSAAFFLSIEFQESGYLVYRIYKAAYGSLPNTPVPLTLQEFSPDAQQIGQGVVVGASGWEQQLENNKTAFVSEFVGRSRFTNAYPSGLTPEQFVDALNMNAGGVLSQAERDQLVSELVSGMKSRAQVLRVVAEDPDLAHHEFNKAFVLMQYFGYLRRNPNDAPDNNFNGYNFWLDKLNQFNGNFVEAEMVKAFLVSQEYRQRFGNL